MLVNNINEAQFKQNKNFFFNQFKINEIKMYFYFLIKKFFLSAILLISKAHSLEFNNIKKSYFVNISHLLLIKEKQYAIKVQHYNKMHYYRKRNSLLFLQLKNSN